MTLLFMMPNYHAATEVWMRRMLESLEEKISGLVVKDSTGESTWRGIFPVFSVNPPRHEVRFLSSLLKKFGIIVYKQSKSPEETVLKTIESISPTKILCHYGTFASSFTKVWNKVDIPLYIHFHGYDATFDLRKEANPDNRVHPDDYMKTLLGLQERALFLANSNFTKALLVDGGISADRVKVKYYGIPVPEKSKVHSTNKQIMILHLGRLIDFKSPDRTIKAFEIAKSKGLDGTLLIAGDGNLRNYCELLRLRSPYKNSIHLLGSVSRESAQELFFTADIYTQHNILGELTRQSECFGVSPVEAMAAGLPVVGTRSGGLLESVIDGETGFLNEPGDVEAQAESFLQLANNPDLRQQMGDAGRRHVAEHFSPEQEKNQLIQIMGLEGNS